MYETILQYEIALQTKSYIPFIVPIKKHNTVYKYIDKETFVDRPDIRFVVIFV